MEGILMFEFYMLSKLLFMSGVILMLVWASKNLAKDKLRNTAISLIVIGIALCVISSKDGRFGRFGKWHGSQKDHSMMLEILGEHDIDVTEEEWNAIMDEVMEAKRASWKK